MSAYLTIYKNKITIHSYSRSTEIFRRLENYANWEKMTEWKIEDYRVIKPISEAMKELHWDIQALDEKIAREMKIMVPNVPMSDEVHDNLIMWQELKDEYINAISELGLLNEILTESNEYYPDDGEPIEEPIKIEVLIG